MSLHKFVLVPILVFFWSQFLLAGQITLQNGDRLSGVIEKSDDKSLVIKTDYAGEVIVQLSAIKAIESDKPLHVGLKDGQTVVGLVKTTDDKVEVVPANGSPVEVSTGTIKQIRNDQEAAARRGRFSGSPAIVPTVFSRLSRRWIAVGLAAFVLCLLGFAATDFVADT